MLLLSSASVLLALRRPIDPALDHPATASAEKSTEGDADNVHQHHRDPHGADANHHHACARGDRHEDCVAMPIVVSIMTMAAMRVLLMLDTTAAMVVVMPIAVSLAFMAIVAMPPMELDRASSR